MSAAGRVVLVSHTGQLGGAELAMLRLVDAVDRGRFDLSAALFEAGPLADQFAARGIAVHHLDGGSVSAVTRADAGRAGALRNAVSTLRIARELGEHVRSTRADLVVANSLKAAVVCGFAPRSRTPWAWHLHDRLAADYLPAMLVPALRTLARMSPRVVVVNSRAVAATLRPISSKKVVLAYPGLESKAFDGVPGYETDGLDRAIGMVGRVSATKGQREFLDAVEILGADGIRPPVRIVGAALFQDAEVEQALRDRTRASPALAHVEWRGWMDDPGTEMRSFRLLVHASPVPEPFGQVVVEAMAAGVPVVAADAGGVPEILDPEGRAGPVVDGVRAAPYGLLVRPGDPPALARAIRMVLDDPGAATARARGARMAARERFGISATADAVEHAWMRCMSRPRGSDGGHSPTV